MESCTVDVVSGDIAFGFFLYLTKRLVDKKVLTASFAKLIGSIDKGMSGKVWGTCILQNTE